MPRPSLISMDAEDFNAREVAAIQLQIPSSGHDELDEMIWRSLRIKFAREKHATMVAMNANNAMHAAPTPGDVAVVASQIVQVIQSTQAAGFGAEVYDGPKKKDDSDG